MIYSLLSVYAHLMNLLSETLLQPCRIKPIFINTGGDFVRMNSK